MQSVAAAQKLSNCGATPDDWLHWEFMLGLGKDLLPVVSDASVMTDSASDIAPSRGKVPSIINSRGYACGIAAWTARSATHGDIGSWLRESRYGICLQTRCVRAIDIDVTDPALADRIHHRVVETLGVDPPVRKRSNSSKRLLLIEAPGELRKQAFRVSEGDPLQRVELLANGQQCVVVGMHPSGVPYEWEGGYPTEIPAVPLDRLLDLWRALAREFAVDVATQQRTAAPGHADDMDRQIALDTVDEETIDDIRSALEAFSDEDADDYDVWCSQVGQALKSLAQAGHDDDASALWHEFSARSSRYDAAQAAAKWSGFNPTSITYRSIFTWAAERGWRNPRSAELETERERSVRIGREGEHAAPVQRIWTGSELLGELVFIADGSRVAPLNSPRDAQPLHEFKALTAASKEVVKGKRGQRAVHRVDLWLESAERKTVRTTTFAPGKPAICESPEGDTSLNLWQPRRAATPDSWEDLSRPFFDHVRYLVPVEAERERFLDWLAHIEQEPGTLPHSHYLLIARQTGIGRNWLGYALARAFAGYTALGFDLPETLRSGFNGALSQRLLAVVDELHEGGPGGMNRSVAEKLKSLLTEQTRRVNPKYGRQHVEFNCCRFLMFSNHAAALPLAENDRRVVVIENPSERRPAQYYAELYRLLNTPGFGAALAEAFRRRDIGRFNPGEVAPMSEAKAKTIRAGRSEMEQAVRDIAAEWPAECITSSRLQSAVAESLGGRVGNLQGVCVAAGLVKREGRVKVAGVAAHVWILRDHGKWVAAVSSDVAAEVRRGEQTADADAFEPA